MREPQPQSLNPAERLDWLRLIRSDNVGPITFYKLLEHFGTAGAALDALPEMARRGGRSKAFKVFPKAAALREMDALEKMGAALIAWCEADYPPLIAHIEDAPPLLSVMGHRHLLAKKTIGVVGARNASINARKFAGKISADLGRGGLLVASGLARGIDAAAHEGALATGTVAVTAGGVDVIYPKENAALYQRIVEQGAVISEIPPGTKPQARHFPRRNRLISGLGRGVVVIEASPRSGSLITARMALEQGREVFAVPGAAGDPRARGANDLIRQGAVLCETADDIFKVLNERSEPSLEERKSPGFTGVSSSRKSAEIPPGTHKAIEESLNSAPVTVDEIIRNCQLSPAVVSAVLLELELAGRVERHPGNQVSRTHF